jgi:carbamoyl-phosphate synthase large subunit
VAVVRDREELAYRTRALRAPVIQEYLGSDDDEYTAGIVCFDGSAQASIVMRRDLRDGNTYRAYTEPFSELNAKVRQIAEALGAYGPVNLQFRLHKDQLVVFEINARFSGTTPLRALCGFNEVEMVLRHVLFGEPVRQPEVRNMTILRHWSETVVEPERIAALRD